MHLPEDAGQERLEQERAFLQPYLDRAARGEIATAVEIQRAFEEEAKQPVAKSTISRFLARHGLQQLGASSSLATVSHNFSCTLHLPLKRRTAKNVVTPYSSGVAVFTLKRSVHRCSHFFNSCRCRR